MTKRILLYLFLAFTLTGCGSDFRPSITSDPGTVSAAGPVFTKKSFINQVGPIPETTILTPSADGDYIMSIVITAPPTPTAVPDPIGLTPIWTDENGAVNPDLPPFRISGFANGPGTDPLRLQLTASLHTKAGMPIKFVGLTGGDSINKYSAYVTVQALQ